MSKSNQSYTLAPPPAAHHASGIYKPVNTSQTQQIKPTLPSGLVQLSSSKVHFAGSASSTGHNIQHTHPNYRPHGPIDQEITHPVFRHPGPAQAQVQQQQANLRPFHTTAITQQTHYTPAQNPQMYKTPARPAAQMVPNSSQAPNSSSYMLGDKIELPDIMTDSEDEDDDENGGFRVPSWAASPMLKAQLEAQQLIDPETIFGPIGEMNMEEMFKHQKLGPERMKQFRSRSSSALWVENRDQITSAEKRTDRELRAQIVTQGCWSFEVVRNAERLKEAEWMKAKK